MDGKDRRWKGERRTSWIKGINIDGEIDRSFRPNSIPDLLDDPLHPNRVNLSRLHNLKSAISIIIIITQPTQRRAYASVDVGIIS